MLDVDDERPVEDILWTEEGYQYVHHKAGLVGTNIYRPLGRESEPYDWVNETAIAPWNIHVLAAKK